MDASTGFAVANNGVVVRTTDGGSNWTTLNTGSTASLQYVHFCDVNNGMAVGYGGATIRTNDGGNTWFSENTGTTADLYSCYMISPTVAIVAGDSGIMRKNNNLLSGMNNLHSSAITVTIFPNPFSTTTCFLISGTFQSQDVRLRVYSPFGTTLIDIPFNEHRQAILDAHDLPSGFYLYAIIRKEEVITTGRIVRIQP